MYARLTVESIFACAIDSGYLTPVQRSALKMALQREALSNEEKSFIDRLLYAVRRGWLELTD